MVIACITNLPDATFVFIRQEHTHFGLSVKEVQGRIAFHVLAIWSILATGVNDKASLIKEMFYDLESKEECADIFDKFSWVTSRGNGTGTGNKVNNILMGTKILGKGQKSKSSTAASQGNCPSTNPLNPIRENGEIMDMEEQMLELGDDNENNDSSTSGGQQSQPLITSGQVHLNDMGATTDNLGQSINVTFAVENENSRNTPPNPHVLLRDVNQEQSQGVKLAALSDELLKWLEQKQLIRHCPYKAGSLINGHKWF